MKIYYRPPKVKVSKNKKNRPLPDWNNNINNLDKYKLTPTEVLKRKINSMSKNLAVAKKELKEKKDSRLKSESKSLEEKKVEVLTEQLENSFERKLKVSTSKRAPGRITNYERKSSKICHRTSNESRNFFYGHDKPKSGKNNLPYEQKNYIDEKIEMVSPSITQVKVASTKVEKKNAKHDITLGCSQNSRKKFTMEEDIEKQIKMLEEELDQKKRMIQKEPKPEEEGTCESPQRSFDECERKEGEIENEDFNNHLGDIDKLEEEMKKLDGILTSSNKAHLEFRFNNEIASDVSEGKYFGENSVENYFSEKKTRDSFGQQNLDFPHSYHSGEMEYEELYNEPTPSKNFFSKEKSVNPRRVEINRRVIDVDQPENIKQERSSEFDQLKHILLKTKSDIDRLNKQMGPEVDPNEKNRTYDLELEEELQPRSPPKRFY